MADTAYLTVEHLSTSELRKFFSNIERTTGGCWSWTASLDSCGYAMSFYRGRKEKAHRLFYAFLVAPLPRGLGRTIPQLDHIVCSNKRCCNPAHLALVTPRANSLRGNNGTTAVNARKTQCPRGHVLVKEANRARRWCPTCDLARHAARRHGARAEHYRQLQRENARRHYYRSRYGIEPPPR